METLTSVLAISAGLLLRLALPIFGTGLLIFFLRKLDAHWQAEAEQPQIRTEKLECWKLKGCSDEQRSTCRAASSPLPCWQAYRMPNGYLQERCISCDVFINAPIPALKMEPRRM